MALRHQPGRKDVSDIPPMTPEELAAFEKWCAEVSACQTCEELRAALKAAERWNEEHWRMNSGAIEDLEKERDEARAERDRLRETLERIGWHELSWKEARDVARDALAAERSGG
jgi:hypothetical protein